MFSKSHDIVSRLFAVSWPLQGTSTFQMQSELQADALCNGPGLAVRRLYVKNLRCLWLWHNLKNYTKVVAEQNPDHWPSVQRSKRNRVGSGWFISGLVLEDAFLVGLFWEVVNVWVSYGRVWDCQFSFFFARNTPIVACESRFIVPPAALRQKPKQSNLVFGRETTSNRRTTSRIVLTYMKLVWIVYGWGFNTRSSKLFHARRRTNNSEVVLDIRRTA